MDPWIPTWIRGGSSESRKQSMMVRALSSSSCWSSVRYVPCLTAWAALSQRRRYLEHEYDHMSGWPGGDFVS